MANPVPQCHRPCTVDGCASLVGRKGARGYCTKHYQMWRLTGDPCGSTAPTLSQRLFAKTVKTDGCWEWTGNLDGSGYGQLSNRTTTIKAHRLSYEIHVGPIPPGLVLDHLCRVRHCVNPAHLEPVSNQENLDRGWGRRIKNGWVDSCLNGHKYTAENTYVNTKGRLTCRTCRADSRKRYEERKKAA